MESIFKLKNMREKVKAELEHIPRGDFNQNMFRQAYWAIRLHGLGKKAEKEISKEDAICRATEIIQRNSADFCPTIDTKFFDINKLLEYSKNNPKVLSCMKKMR